MITISRKKNLVLAIQACLKNAERLLNESEMLEFENPLATKYFYSVIAQEECAKAFLLYMVSINVIPWSRYVFRALEDHKCKQLICVVLDHLCPDDDTWSEIIKSQKLPGYPKKVSDALQILRYEKIGRWKSSNWVWAEDPKWDREAKKIAEGFRDRMKQDALYVRLNKFGKVVTTPDSIAKLKAEYEYERAQDFRRFTQDISEQKPRAGLNYEIIENSFKLLFSEVLD